MTLAHHCKPSDYTATRISRPPLLTSQEGAGTGGGWLVVGGGRRAGSGRSLRSAPTAASILRTRPVVCGVRSSDRDVGNPEERSFPEIPVGDWWEWIKKGGYSLAGATKDTAGTMKDGLEYNMLMLQQIYGKYADPEYSLTGPLAGEYGEPSFDLILRVHER